MGVNDGPAEESDAAGTAMQSDGVNIDSVSPGDELLPRERTDTQIALERDPDEEFPNPLTHIIEFLRAFRAELPREVKTSGITKWRAVGIARMLLTQLIIVTQKLLLVRSHYHWLTQQVADLRGWRGQLHTNQQDLTARMSDVEARLAQAGIPELDV